MNEACKFIYWSLEDYKTTDYRTAGYIFGLLGCQIQ